PHCSSCYITPPLPPYTHPLSLHDALPICHPSQPQPLRPRRHLPRRTGPNASQPAKRLGLVGASRSCADKAAGADQPCPPAAKLKDRKSTRLNSSHGSISYAVFCLKKKNHK